LFTIKNVVLPILEDFKPDLVVNSAGQDNHYSDPITNMNFSAQGYAELNRILQPDIAVLEGGYSIEGALPYVNVGIILAMAGIGYDKVREPDYDPEQIRQKPEVSEWIKRTGQRVLDVWQAKGSIREQLRDGKTFHERDRRIFYDTDNIIEHQHETLRFCDDCSGALKIDSRSSKGFRIRAVHVPVSACATCRKQGRDWFDEPSGEMDFVFLQDRPTDQFLERKKT
jgi:hypothetical protein